MQYPFVNPNKAVEIVPDSDDEFAPSTLYVGGSGDISVEPSIGGNEVTFYNIEAPFIIPLKVIRVLSGGILLTEASDVLTTEAGDGMGQTGATTATKIIRMYND